MRLAASFLSAILLVAAMAGCDSGPESGEIEETLSDKVRKVSDKPVDITCPEDSASTEVGETIDCRRLSETS